MSFLPLVFTLSPGAPKLQFVPEQEAALHDCMLQRSSEESSCALLFPQMEEGMFCGCPSVSFSGLKCWAPKLDENEEAALPVM